MKVLLISPPSHFGPPVFAPLGICYISSYLKERGIEASCYDMFDNSFSDVERLIKKENPDIVGISCFTNLRMEAVEVARIAKRINPNCRVFMGGAHASCMGEQMLENYPIDYIVHREGEKTTYNLINNLNKPQKVNGISFIKNGMITTPPAPFIDNLDNLPFPDVENLIENNYKNLTFLYGGEKIELKKKSFTMITSRGCPYNCIFCSTPRFWGRRWRGRSPENILKEIEFLHDNYGVEHIHFADDSFTINQKRTMKLCKMLPKEITFDCETRVNCVSEELIKAMKKAGCLIIFYGIESGSPKILKNINKMITREQIIKAFKITKEAGIPTKPFLIIGNPGENLKTIKETIDLIKKIKPDDMYCALLLVYPDTRLYDIAKEKGMMDDSHWLENKDPPVFIVENPEIKLRYYQFKVISKFLRQSSYYDYFKFMFSRITTFWRYFKRKTH